MIRKIIVIGLMFVCIPTLAHAVQQSTSTVVKVTCAPALSVSVDMPEYDFGSVGPDSIQISASSVTVTNDSLGRTEDYTVNCDTYTTPTSGTAYWTIDLDGNPGADKFSLQALFKATNPLAGDFAANDFFDDQVGFQNMNSNQFTVDGSGYDGNDVTKDTVRILWFRIHTPWSTSTQIEQKINVTITAEDASSF